jgi:hypothetical protein
MTAALSYGQIKVVSSGWTKIGDTAIAPTNGLHYSAPNALGMRVDRTGFPADRYLLVAHGGTNGYLNSNFGRFDFRVQNTNVISATPGLDVGIGRTSPTVKLDVNGDIRYNGTISNASDKRLKSNINSFNYGLNEVLQLNPVTYNYNGLAGISNTTELNTGLVAQELAKVAPTLVSEFEHVEYTDAEGTEIKETGTYLQIEESAIKYMLVNAIKDQQELIEAQAEKIAALEEAINTIGVNGTLNRSEITLNSYDLAELAQNKPNPFNGTTVIDYVVPSNAQNAQISIFGTNGQLLKTLDIDHVGEGSLTVNASDLPSGTYSYQLIVDGRSVETHKMVSAK